ncbi:MAG: sensor histidine kinase [Propionibacteriaceae bacterium]
MDSGVELAGDAGLRHNAFVYESQEDYLAVAVPFLQQGLELGQGAVVANTKGRLGAIRDALGAHSSGVTFVDVSEAYTRPARTLAGYHHVYAEELSRCTALRAVADVQFGPVPAEWELWTGYEAVFNRSFADLPVWVLCSYTTRELPDLIREGIWRAHPEVVTSGTWHASASYDPRNRPWRPDTGHQPLEHPEEIDVGAGVEALRGDLIESMHRHGLPSVRVLDLLMATTEILDNASTHGQGVRAVRVGRLGGRYVCEVVDHGPGFDDPLAGYLAPHPGRGSGLWVVRQLTWDLEFFHRPDGFTARLTA